MKSRLLIIIGVVVVAVSLSYYVIYDSSTTVFVSCDPRYGQIDDKCVLLKPEQYCTDWCDLQELSNFGCNQPVLDYIYRYTNLFDEKFDGVYYHNFVGLPVGVSKENFQECVDFIYEKRTSVKSKPTLISTNGTGYVTIASNSFLSVEVMCPTDNQYPSHYQILFDKVPYDTKVQGVQHVSGVRDGTEYNGFVFDFENTTNESESATIQVNCSVTPEPRTEPEPEPIPESEPTYTLTEVNCFTNQVIYNDECVYVLTPDDEFPKEMIKYFLMVDGVILNFCEIEPATVSDRENNSGVTLDRCFEISSYIISDVNVIKFQSTTPPTWINIKLENLTRNVELGSSPTFRVVESGWGNGCTSPTLEVYHMKQEIGNDHTDGDLIYKRHIVYSCPYYEPRFPPPDILRIWDESDFPNFPICEEQGRYLIIGDSGYERVPLDYYYCGMENEK